MNRFVCVHGHFYQPPRENAWLEAVEVQDSAHPFHDWNERITAECYAPNAAARILDEEGRIARIVNNYARMSFNFGPTLLTWLAREAPLTYAAVLEADRVSRERFSGHGSALAQGYGHAILPLCNERDRRTQIAWGVADFVHRFGRKPEGMWLPEAAVDLATLEALAEAGIAFTILAPSQAARVRPLGSRDWTDVSGGRIDPSRAYRAALPSGRGLALFFYDGPVSQAVAFERLLSNGETFAGRLVSAFSDAREGAQLAHIATDGESYGHHHGRGEMALAWALETIETRGLASVTNYGEFLQRFPPKEEVEVFDNSSWSCVHGVERWRAHCGCNSGGRPGWKQTWRGPLREALDRLRDALAPRWEARASQLFRDPWGARDAYVQVVLDRDPARQREFLERHAARPLAEPERVAAIKLMELQRHAMLMYTSCAWFFDEVSGIETVQVLQYAARVLQLAGEVLGEGGALEATFLEDLSRAESNLPEHKDARRVYERFVRPAAVDLPKVAAHYATSALFEDYADTSQVYCYQVERQAQELHLAGRARLAVGRCAIGSQITGEEGTFSYAALHLGDHTLVGGVRPYRGEQDWERLHQELTGVFSRADFHATLRLLDLHFAAGTYSLRSLFQDEQRKVVRELLKATLQEAEEAYDRLYQAHAPFLRFLSDLGARVPRRLRLAAEMSLQTRLRDALGESPPEPMRVEALLEEARAGGLSWHEPELAEAGRRAVERAAQAVLEEPFAEGALEGLLAAVEVAFALPVDVDLWRAQELIWLTRGRHAEEAARRASRGDQAASAWLARFREAGARLSVRVD